MSGCRIEVWEETQDLWRHRLERHDRDAPLTSFEVAEEALLPDRRYAAACRCAGPAVALRPKHSYYWYVTPTNAGGHDAFAPAEGVFSVDERG